MVSAVVYCSICKKDAYFQLTQTTFLTATDVRYSLGVTVLKPGVCSLTHTHTQHKNPCSYSKNCALWIWQRTSTSYGENDGRENNYKNITDIFSLSATSFQYNLEFGYHRYYSSRHGGAQIRGRRAIPTTHQIEIDSRLQLIPVSCNHLIRIKVCSQARKGWGEKRGNHLLNFIRLEQR